MFAHDRGWVRRCDEAIKTGLTAEAAVERVQNDTRARMLRQTDPYLRERLRDLDDLADRLLRILPAAITRAARESLPQNAILVARTMGPAELLDYDRKRLRGLVLEEGGRHSHVAIVAKALGIAAVGQARGVIGARRSGRCHHRRRRDRRGASAPAAGRRSPPMPTRRASARGGSAVSRPARRACRHQGRRRDRRCISMPGWCVDMPHLDGYRAPTASACSAPSCSS